MFRMQKSLGCGSAHQKCLSQTSRTVSDLTRNTTDGALPWPQVCSFPETPSSSQQVLWKSQAKSKKTVEKMRKRTLLAKFRTLKAAVESAEASTWKMYHREGTSCCALAIAIMMHAGDRSSKAVAALCITMSICCA